MRIEELYMLSLIEPFEVIEAMDDRAHIIKKINSFTTPEYHIQEIADITNLSTYRVRKLINLKKKNDAGEDVIKTLGRKRAVTDDAIINLLGPSGYSETVANTFGMSIHTARARMRICGYVYNPNVNKWEKQ